MTQYIGEPKERVEVRVKVVSIDKKASPNPTFYNNSYYHVELLAFNDEHKIFMNEVVWHASKKPDMIVGEEYTIKATVKDHASWNNKRVTRITRTNIINDRPTTIIQPY